MRYETTVDRVVIEAVKKPDATIRAILNLDNVVNVISGSSTIFFIKPLRREGRIFRSIHTLFSYALAHRQVSRGA
jgi:predicted short-subunit dehydrogenase-like oxidoreductase (DUF2520 family)